MGQAAPLRKRCTVTVSRWDIAGGRPAELWTQALFIIYISSVGLILGKNGELDHLRYLPVLSCVNIIVVKTLPVSRSVPFKFYQSF